MSSLQIITGPVIEAGESLSDAIDCGNGEMVRITMPADWSGGVLTFAISTDGEGFNDVYSFDGDEVAINVVRGSAVFVPQAMGRAVKFIKFRSGTSKNPQPQEQRREFAVAVEQGGGADIEVTPQRRS